VTVSKNEISSPMTKSLLMKYTFIALCVITAVSFLSFGIPAIFIAVISVIVAISSDALLAIVSKKTFNAASSAVCGLIVALSYSLGFPYATSYSIPTMEGYTQYLFPALIAAVAVIVFKRLQGVLGRKYVNPAAAAKLLVLAFLWNVALIPSDHHLELLSPAKFESYLQMCYSYNAPFKDPFLTLTILKSHGWIGGASSITVIAVGLCLFLLCRRYIKWRITLATLVTIAVISCCVGLINGDNLLLRVAFHLFVGSVIFLAFFMATDPATTPITHMGQLIFGVGLGFLTVILQLYMNFLGGSILALIIMNLSAPLLDKVGLPKPSEERIAKKLPKAKKFKSAKTVGCIRCGVCTEVCCMNLSPVLIKEAFEKGDIKKVKNLRADLCVGCGYCSLVCPSRIDLKSIVQNAKSSSS